MPATTAARNNQGDAHDDGERGKPSPSLGILPPSRTVDDQHGRYQQPSHRERRNSENCTHLTKVTAFDLPA